MAGPGRYSSLANGRYDSTTLSHGHQKWGHIWAQQGYLAILVDGFARSGFPDGIHHQGYSQRRGKRQRGHGAAVRCLWRVGLFAHTQRRRARSDRAAGLVERRERHACDDVVHNTGAEIADAGHRVSRRRRVLSRLRTEGKIQGGPPPLRPGPDIRRHRR